MLRRAGEDLATRDDLSAIRARSCVRSPNTTPEQLEDLIQFVQDTSPVRDILASPEPVSTTLEILT